MKTKLIDFSDFLKLVPSETGPSGTNRIAYNSLVENQDPRRNMGQDVGTFKKQLIPIVYGDKLSVLRSSLMYQAILTSEDITADEMFSEHSKELGSPTHLVRVSIDTLMAANPKDFKRIHSLHGTHGLLVLAKVRTKIYFSDNVSF